MIRKKKKVGLDDKYKKSKSGKTYGAISPKQLIALSDNTTDVILLGGGR